MRKLTFNFVPGLRYSAYGFIGQTVGYNSASRDRDLPFTAKDEPATLPRVAELIIITDLSPWCTIVQNPSGVTMNDICTTVWKECVSHRAPSHYVTLRLH